MKKSLLTTTGPFIMAIFFLLPISCGSGKNGAIKGAGIVDGDIISIKVMVSGTITTCNMHEGQKVDKGTILAEIDSRKLDNNVEELDIKEKDIDLKSHLLEKRKALLLANIDYLSRQVERFKRLNQKAAVSGDQLEQTELKLLEARTSLFDLKNQLSALEVQKQAIENKRDYLRLMAEDHRVRSPVSGIVLETFASSGETVFPGGNLADILKLSGLYVEVFLEEKETGRLKLNQEAIIEIDGLDQTYKGIITSFGRKAEFSPKYIISEKERQGLLYRVKVGISPEDAEHFKVGMPVTVVFE